MTAIVTPPPFSEHPISDRNLETNNAQKYLVIPFRLVNSHQSGDFRSAWIAGPHSFTRYENWQHENWQHVETGLGILTLISVGLANFLR